MSVKRKVSLGKDEISANVDSNAGDEVTHDGNNLPANKQKVKSKGVNNMKAIGMIETRGLTAAIEAVDSMLKAAEVELVCIEKIGSGLVTAVVQGDVGAVKAATESGAEAAGRIGEIVAVHVIPRGHADIAKLLPGTK